ncbi:retrovirus-related pol polyprotein from transposon TNT 1-94 [Tanacetum coccineum]
MKSSTPSGTDISEITRKPSKTGKHGHENGRVYKSQKPKPEKVKSTVNSIFPQLDSGLALPKFLPTDDPIESLNKAMAFLSEGHIARQCTQPKRAQNSEWFKENMLLAQAQEAGVALDEEQRAFLVDTGKRVDSCLNAQALTTTTIFQTNDLDAFDYDCDEAPTASAIFMANLSAYESDVLSEVQNYDTYQDNNVIDQEMHYSEQPVFVNDLNIKITSDNNVISYDQYLKENKNEVKNMIKNKSLTVKLERYKELVKVFKERQTFALTDREKHIDSQMRAMNSYDDLVDKYDDMEKSFIDEYNKCLELEAELSKKKDMVEKDVYNELSNKFSTLEKHCISLEIVVQQSKESFQNDKPCNNQDAPEFHESFEINELKARLQAKNTTFGNLKKHITNLKGKSVSDCTEPVNNSNVLAPGMFKLDLQPLFPKLRKNREAHVDYLKQTKEHVDTLHAIVEHARALKPLDNALDYAWKSKKQSHKPKSENSIQEKLYLLHMDLCRPMRVKSINDKKYILVIVDDYSRFTWVKFLRSKDENSEFVIKFLKKVQVALNATVRYIRTDNGTEFVNQTLRSYYEDVGITHQTSVARTPEQSGVVESEDLGKLKPKADIGIFIGYSPAKKAYRIYNKWTRLIMEMIHVKFDELTAMAFEQFGSRPAPQLLTIGFISSGLVQNPSSSTPYVT